MIILENDYLFIKLREEADESAHLKFVLEFFNKTNTELSRFSL